MSVANLAVDGCDCGDVSADFTFAEGDELVWFGSASDDSYSELVT